MNDPQQTDRAAKALRRAIAPGPDDLAHPDYQELVALAEGTLGAVDADIVQTHIAQCMQCAEDVKDIRELHEQMAVTPGRTSSAWKYFTAAAVAAAAILIVAVMFKTPEPAVVPQEASAPPASLRELLLSRDEQTAVDAAIAGGRVDVPAAARDLAGSMGQLLGPETATAPLWPMSPAGTFVVDASPTFSWRPVSGAVSYRVAVFDAAFREVASSGPLTSSTSTSWKASVAMPRNVPLAWQVTAQMRDGSAVLAPAPPRPEARFAVLDEVEAAKIANLRTRLADQPVALGILLAKAGLVDEAARAFDRAATDPARADVAAKLRASLFDRQ